MALLTQAHSDLSSEKKYKKISSIFVVYTISKEFPNSQYGSI